MPKGNLNILSNLLLCKAGITTNHGLNDPHLKLTNGVIVPMKQSRGISVVDILPPRVPFNATATIVHESPELWHQRTMHVGLKKLQMMKVLDAKANLDGCKTCTSCKVKVRALKLDPSKKTLPERPLELLVLDLMVPTKGQSGAFLIATDAYSKMIQGEFVKDYRAKTLLTALKLILMRFGKNPKAVVN